MPGPPFNTAGRRLSGIGRGIIARNLPTVIHPV